MRVASLNIHAGRCGTGAKNPSLSQIAEGLRSVSPDICFLQEVDRRMPRSGFADQAQLLAGAMRAVGENDWYWAFYGRLNFGVFGQYGNALLSRSPLEGVRRLPLPATGGEGRGAVGAIVAGVAVWSVHLGLRDEWRETQLSALAGAVIADANAGHAVIVGGDFNAAADAPEVARFAARTGLVAVSPDAPTFPANAPIHRIDFLWASSGATVVDAGVIAAPEASDHALVWADMTGA